MYNCCCENAIERVSILRFFDIENPVWSTFSKVMDVIILNFFFIVCCIPVITIPASLTALYYTSMRLLSGNITYVHKDFFDSFKSNFKQGLLVGVLVFDAGVILAVLTYLSFASGSYLGKVVLTVLDVFFAASVTYTFPILAKFTVETKEIFRNSVIMAVVHIPFTFLNVGLLFICTVPVYYTLPMKVIMLFFGCSAAALLKSVWLNYIFKKYLDSETMKNDEIFREEERIAKKEKKAKDNSISARARKR